MSTSQKHEKWSCEGSYQSQPLSEYLDFLCNHRGLTENTIRFRSNDVTSLLQSLRLQNDLEDIGKVSAKQVYDYIIKTAKLMTRPSRRHLVASIRSFLKFCHLKGYVQRDLTEAVPVIGTPKLWSVPRGIPWKSVEQLLAVPDRETHGGRRTYVVLRLLATYGVRIVRQQNSGCRTSTGARAQSIFNRASAGILCVSLFTRRSQMPCLPISGADNEQEILGELLIFARRLSQKQCFFS